MKNKVKIQELEVPKNIYRDDSVPSHEIKVTRLLVNKHSPDEKPVLVVGEPTIEDGMIIIKKDGKKLANILFYGNEFVEGESTWHYVYKPLNDVAKDLFNQISNKVDEGALDTGIQSYSSQPTASTSSTTSSQPMSTSSKGTAAVNTAALKKPEVVQAVDKLKKSKIAIQVVEEKDNKKSISLEYVSEVIDNRTGEISKPFTIGAKNYQMVRAMRPDRTIVMGVYAIDDMGDSGNCKIYEVNEFEKMAINELGVQEPEGRETATLNPYPEKNFGIKEENKKETTQQKSNFEGYKHFIVNEKTGKVRKFGTIQELAKASMSEEEKYMGVKEFKKFLDETLFGTKKKEAVNEIGPTEKEPTEKKLNKNKIVTSAKILMGFITSVPKIVNGIEKLKQANNPIAKAQVISLFGELIGVPQSKLHQVINSLKQTSKSGQEQQPKPAATQPVTEKRIIKVKKIK